VTVLRNLTLKLVDCAGIRTEQDVLDIVQTVADLGLRPGTGAYTATGQPEPVNDVHAFVPSTHHVFLSDAKTDRRIMAEEWGFGGVWLHARGTRSLFSVARRGPGDDWDVSASILTWSYEQTRLSFERFVSEATTLLETMGTQLRPRACPEFGILYGVTSDEIDLAHAVMRRDLVVGWRTWYGPAYVERYGHDVLLGLPDRTERLNDGGVYHALRNYLT
jgi:hypothetical protein